MPEQGQLFKDADLKVLTLYPETPKDYWKQREGFTEMGGQASFNPSLPEPWRLDGYIIQGLGTDYTSEAAAAWELDDTASVPLVRWIADFYTLEAIAAQVPQGDKVYHPPFNQTTVTNLVRSGVVAKHRQDGEYLSLLAMHLQGLLIEKFTPILHNYLWWACIGEACHHPLVRRYVRPHDEYSSRYGFASLYHGDEVPNDLLIKWMLYLFEKSNWSGGWGGKKWAECTRPLLWFHEGVCGKEPFTAKNFCDRVFALQHNNGTVFNKINWGSTAGPGHPSNDISVVLSMLDSHHNGDYETLLKFATPKVANLWQLAAEGKYPKTKRAWKNVTYPPPTSDYPAATSTGASYVSGCECGPCQQAMAAEKEAIKKMKLPKDKSKMTWPF